MTDKEVRKLSRRELLELLLVQTEDNERLRRELEQTRQALEDRTLAIQNAGSLAEAALNLNGVFQAADAAAKQYLENLKQANKHREEELEKARLQAEEIVEAAREEAARLTAQAGDEAQLIRQKAEKYSAKLRETADAYWNRYVSDSLKG